MVNKRTFVVVPTYNELDNIEPLVRQLLTLPLPQLQLLIVDDNSPDGTGSLAEELRRNEPRLHVLHRAARRGLGSAYRAGFRYALAQGAELIVQMDGDLSHNPQDVPRLVQRAGRYDVVVGSRYAPGGQVDRSWSWWRHGLSQWANHVYVRGILHLPLHDATAGFKCWRRRALLAVLTLPVSSSGYVFQVEMAYLAHRLGFSTCECPIYFAERRQGRSKMDMDVKLEAAWRTWYLLWQYRYVRAGKPLLAPAFAVSGEGE